MYTNEILWKIAQQHHAELLQEAKQSRLLSAAARPRQAIPNLKSSILNPTIRMWESLIYWFQNASFSRLQSKEHSIPSCVSQPCVRA